MSLGDELDLEAIPPNVSGRTRRSLELQKATTAQFYKIRRLGSLEALFLWGNAKLSLATSIARDVIVYIIVMVCRAEGTAALQNTGTASLIPSAGCK